MKELELQIKEYIEQQHLISDPGLPLVVGLSGGADSVALLHILVKLGYQCIPAHCNFQLRDEESERDERFTFELAHSMGLDIKFIRFDTHEYARAHKLSIEMAARELRYQWFEEIRSKYGASCIAVGHHADDNLETVLLNLIRGTGLKGLTGMQAKNGNIIRPLLKVTREEVVEYLTTHSVDYVNDSTNFENEFTRNKIRNQLIPAMQTINPSLQFTFRNTLQHLTDSYQFQQQQVQKLKDELVKSDGESVRISIPQLMDMPDRHFILYEVLSEYNFNSTQVSDIVASLNGISGKQFYAPGFNLIKDRNDLIIHPASTTTCKPVPEIKHTIYARSNTQLIKNNPFTIQVDADQLVMPLHVRKWKKGDYFYPLGLNKRKKVSDFLIDLKIDRATKQKIHVLTCLYKGEEAIVWVVGYRIDHRFRISDTTLSIAEISSISN